MYGELIEILKPGNLSPNIRNLLPYMLQHMGTFTEDDYLLALGDPIAIAAAACIAVELTDGIVKMLKWDKISKTYIPFVIDLRYDDGDGEGGRVPSIGAVYGC